MTASSSSDLASTVLAALLDILRKQKTLGERAITQLTDRQLFETLDSEANSVAIIVKHLHGNMRSRWSDFLTSDGEKPDRHRDSEFELTDSERTRATVLEWWEAGWRYVFSAVEPLKASDLLSDVRIRGQKVSVLSAILRQVDHYAQHIGQIVLIAKHLKGRDWQTLSIPRGKSEEFEAEFRKRLGVGG